MLGIRLCALLSYNLQTGPEQRNAKTAVAFWLQLMCKLILLRYRSVMQFLRLSIILIGRLDDTYRQEGARLIYVRHYSATIEIGVHTARAGSGVFE